MSLYIVCDDYGPPPHTLSTPFSGEGLTNSSLYIKFSLPYPLHVLLALGHCSPQLTERPLSGFCAVDDLVLFFFLLYFKVGAHIIQYMCLIFSIGLHKFSLTRSGTPALYLSLICLLRHLDSVFLYFNTFCLLWSPLLGCSNSGFCSLDVYCKLFDCKPGQSGSSSLRHEKCFYLNVTSLPCFSVVVFHWMALVSSVCVLGSRPTAMPA